MKWLLEVGSYYNWPLTSHIAISPSTHHASDWLREHTYKMVRSVTLLLLEIGWKQLLGTCYDEERLRNKKNKNNMAWQKETHWAKTEILKHRKQPLSLSHPTFVKGTERQPEPEIISL